MQLLSARQFLLIYIGIVIIAFIPMKCVQIFLEGSYSESPTLSIGVGLVRRLDDPSLWSLIAALAAAIFIYWAVTYSNEDGSVRSVTLNRFIAAMTTSGFFAVAVAVYLINVATHKGTFFNDSHHWGVQGLQQIEGMISVSAMFAAYIFIGLAIAYMWQCRSDIELLAYPDSRIRMSYIVMAGLMPIYTSIVYVAVYGVLQILSRISPEVKEAMDLFRVQKLPEAIATQLLFWLPMIVVGAIAAVIWRRGFSWKLIHIGGLPLPLLYCDPKRTAPMN